MKLQGLVAGGEVFAMETVEINSRPGKAGVQSCSDQWTQPRRSGTRSCGVQEQPQVRFDQPWCSDGDDRQQQTQVKCDYGKQPRSADSPKGQGEDGLLQDARKLCALFKEQELVTHQINSSLTDMCMQLVADNASQVKEAAAAPMEVRGLELGRGRV